MSSRLAIIVIGVLALDPFGIPLLKRKIPVHEKISLAGVGVDESLSFGPFTIGASIIPTAEENGVPTEVDLDLKLAVMGLELVDEKLPLAQHLSDGALDINVGGPQLGFTGSVQVVDLDADTAPASLVGATSIQSLTVGGVVFAPSAPPVVGA